MAFDLQSIKSSKKTRPRRILACGLHKTGKSTLAGQAPKPLFLPIEGEEGIDDLDVECFPVIKTYSDLMEALGTVYAGEHEHLTLVPDSISTLEPIMHAECCRINGGVDSIEKVGGGFNKGYTEVLQQWSVFLHALDAIRNERNMTIILVGHVKVEKHNDPMCEPYDRYALGINKKAAALIERWLDGILFINHKTIVKKDDVGFNKTQNRAVDIGCGVPVMYTQPRPSHPGGGRGAWGHLPYELPLSWPALDGALEQAEVKLAAMIAEQKAAQKAPAKTK